MSNLGATTVHYSYLRPFEELSRFGLIASLSEPSEGAQYHVPEIFGALWVGASSEHQPSADGKFCWGNMRPQDMPVPLCIQTPFAADDRLRTEQTARRLGVKKATKRGVRTEWLDINVVAGMLDIDRPYLLIDLYGLTCGAVPPGAVQLDYDPDSLMGTFREIGVEHEFAANLFLIPTSRDAAVVKIRLALSSFPRADPAVLGVRAWAVSRSVGMQILAKRRSIAGCTL